MTLAGNNDAIPPINPEHLHLPGTKMLKTSLLAFAFLTVAITISAPPAHAQAALQSQARPGSYGNTSGRTNNFRRADSVFTTSQRLASVPMTGLGGVASIHGPTGRNGLPVTSLDSFVLNAGGAAELIYGDEGTTGPPPYDEFTSAHRIQTGIQGARASGLTTGHGSYLPCAWGGDEFVDGPEWSQSAQGGGGNYWANQVPVGASPGTRPDMDGALNQVQPDTADTNSNNGANDSGF